MAEHGKRHSDVGKGNHSANNWVDRVPCVLAVLWEAPCQKHKTVINRHYNLYVAVPDTKAIPKEISY